MDISLQSLLQLYCRNHKIQEKFPEFVEYVFSRNLTLERIRFWQKNYIVQLALIFNINVDVIASYAEALQSRNYSVVMSLGQQILNQIHICLRNKYCY